MVGTFRLGLNPQVVRATRSGDWDQRLVEREIERNKIKMRDHVIAFSCIFFCRFLSPPLSSIKFLVKVCKPCFHLSVSRQTVPPVFVLGIAPKLPFSSSDKSTFQLGVAVVAVKTNNRPKLRWWARCGTQITCADERIIVPLTYM